MGKKHIKGLGDRNPSVWCYVNVCNITGENVIQGDIALVAAFI